MEPTNGRPMVEFRPNSSTARVGNATFEAKGDGSAMQFAGVTISGDEIDGKSYVKLEADMLLYRHPTEKDTFINVGHYFRILPGLLRELHALKTVVLPPLVAAYSDPLGHLERVEAVKKIQRWWRYHSARLMAMRHWNETLAAFSV